MRSPTTADLVRTWPGITSDFAGLSNDADERLGAEHLEAADLICVMEGRQARRLQALFPHLLRGKPVHVLNIPDRFSYGAADSDRPADCPPDADPATALTAELEATGN